MGKAEERCRVDCFVVCEEILIWFEVAADGELSSLLSAVFLLLYPVFSHFQSDFIMVWLIDEILKIIS